MNNNTVPQIYHVTPEELLLDSFRLGKKIWESGFRPRYAISIWRGGTPVGLGIDAYFRLKGYFINHTTIATESYLGIGNRQEIIVKGLDHVVSTICAEDHLLIIDDVYETGSTIEKILKILKERARANTPENIVVGTIHRKPGRELHESSVSIINLTEVESNLWIDYPHELADLVDLSDPEDRKIKRKDPQIYDIIRGPASAVEKESSTAPYRYVSSRELLLNSFRLGVKICSDQDFFPDFIIALWPGGVLAGLPIHEVYKYKLKKGELKGKKPDHVSINSPSSLTGQTESVVGFQYLEENINRNDRILLIDTTFRSGQMVNWVVARLKSKLRRNINIENIRVAAVYYNPDDHSTWTSHPIIRAPNYYLKLVDHEIIYPQNVYKLRRPELELKELNPELHEILFG